jgi:NDP-sugar pyrophosphorylase family protein
VDSEIQSRRAPYLKYQMNQIKKIPLSNLGYGFITKKHIPKGKDEYHLRNIQNRSGIAYRNLSAFEIEVLVKNGNTTDNWNNILVSDAFNPELVKACKFYGLIRIGKLEPYFLEYNDFKVPVGLYNSTIISSDFGDNVAIDHVNYMSHYIIGNEVVIVQVDEMKTTANAKFGNGIIKDGESESSRIWLEICNENGGRKVIPFNGMLPGDAWMWSKYRDDKALLDNFVKFTEIEYKTAPGYYGKVGDRTVIKSTNILNDVWIGTDAYIKGANKLKNLTIKSSAEGRTQIGEGCELVNGIIDFGCRIFYGVKAVRFVIASNSQLKYGARLINSYLGSNTTISCCEVLNSLIFSAHEQHHNNSFLCAALILGQSNIPAGATIGSNHNSRGADGEVIAGRGFWPGLCVSMKHNSKFANFTILAKGDYDYELNIPIPFSLISIDEEHNCLVVMPGYWFMYNMYALQRNTFKYKDRDKRYEKIQHIEYDYLAPDTINEMFSSISLFETLVGKAYNEKFNKDILSEEEYAVIGKKLLTEKDEIINDLEITAPNLENAKRKVKIIKIQRAYDLFHSMIRFYGITHLMAYATQHNEFSVRKLKADLSGKRLERTEWLNVGGQLIPEEDVFELRKNIRSNEIKSWDDIHEYYVAEGERYEEKKTLHAITALLEIEQLSISGLTKKVFTEWIKEIKNTKQWMVDSIESSRKKDYTNPFRKMMYDTQEELDEVLGKFDDNVFIKDQKAELKVFNKNLNSFIKKIDN